VTLQLHVTETTI